jgi:hypothetical protein
VVGNKDLTEQFATDFATIWDRVEMSPEKPLGGPEPT